MVSLLNLPAARAVVLWRLQPSHLARQSCDITATSSQTDGDDDRGGMLSTPPDEAPCLRSRNRKPVIPAYCLAFSKAVRMSAIGFPSRRNT
jgi:hypothetical protein